MARIQIKLLIFLIAAGLAAGCIAVAYWIWENMIRHELAVRQELKDMKSSPHALPDPGAKRFDAAVDLIRGGQHEQGREALYRLLQQFPESPTCAEARRIIGEMNMDLLFSPSQLAGKKDYIVQPGDSLSLIARKNNTNMEMLQRMNGLIGITLHPGDHLLVVPLEFDVVVDVSAKSVWLVRKGRFFKEFSAFDVKLPPNVKVPADTSVAAKEALLDGRNIATSDPRSIHAEKWVRAARPGITFRTIPVAKAIVVDPAPPPASAGRKKTGRGASPGQADDPLPAPDSGIFMAKEDLEELFALVRQGSKLTLIR